MKSGDVVIFTDSGHYSRWFYGKLAVVLRTRTNRSGVDYCRVKWLQPVLYHGKYTSESSFKCDNFSGRDNENR